MRNYSSEANSAPKKGLMKKAVLASVALEFSYMGFLYFASGDGEYSKWIRDNIPTVKESLYAVDEIKKASSIIACKIKSTKEQVASKFDEYRASITESKDNIKDKLSAMTSIFKPEKSLESNESCDSTVLTEFKESANEIELKNSIHDDYAMDSVIKMMAEMESWKDYERKMLYEEISRKLAIEEDDKFNEKLKGYEQEMRRKIEKELVWKIEEEKKGKLAKLTLLDAKVKALECSLIENNQMAHERLSLLKLTALAEMLELKAQSGEPVLYEVNQIKRIASQFGNLENNINLVTKVIDDSISCNSVKSLMNLKDDFNEVAPKILSSSVLTNNLITHIISPLIKNFCFPITPRLFKGEENYERLCRASYFIKHDLMEYAVRELSQLQGWSRLAAKEWLDDAKNHLLLRMATDALKSEIRMLKPKKTWKEKAKEVAEHYWNGTKLLAKETSISSKLLWKMMRGESLIRRERQQLSRTTADMFRLVPFLVFIIVPFMEFLLPVALKLFPNMLPSTFEDALQKEEKRKKLLKIRLQMAKFMQETVQEMASMTNDAEAVRELNELFEKMRETGKKVGLAEILGICQKFVDTFSLENMSRPQITSMCKYMNIRPIGTDNFLRFQLRKKMFAIKEDDKLIYQEGTSFLMLGVDSLSNSELKSACQTRGFRIVGVEIDSLKSDLKQWLHFHVKEEIPSSLLLLSKALTMTEDANDGLKVAVSNIADQVVSEVVNEKESFKKRLDEIEKQQELIEAELISKNKDDEDLSKIAEAVTVLTSESPIVEEKKELSEIKEDMEDMKRDLPSTSGPTSFINNRLAKLISSIDDEISSIEREIGQRLFKIQANHEGQLTVEQLEKILSWCREKPDSQRLQRLIKKFDSDGDGRMFVEDILKLTKKDSD